MLASLQAVAADATRDVRQSGSSSGAYGAIGIGLVSVNIPLIGFNETNLEESSDTINSLDIILEGRVQYKRIFAEAVEDSFSNITIGYSLFDNERGSLELIASNLFFDIEYSDIAELESIEDRNGDFNLGFRSSYFFKNKLLQLELLGDIADSHGGFVGAVHVGQQKQILNWNLYGLAGVRYFSDGVIDHLFGVSADETTESIPEFNGKAGVMPSLQLGAVLPLSENWTFNLMAEYAKFPDTVSNSPLAQGDDMFIGRIGFNYILFN